MASKNENLVSGRDLKRYQNATVAGLRDQLRENDLPTDGLKYDLYLRLRDAGVQLYTDRRSNAAAISGISKSRRRSGDGRWDPDGGGFRRRRGGGGGGGRSQDRGRPKAITRGPGQGQGNRPGDGDDGDDDGDDDDGDGSDDGGGGGPPGGGPPGGGPPGGGPPGGGPPGGGDSPGSSQGGDDGGDRPPGGGGGPPGGGDSPGSSQGGGDDDGDQGPPAQWPVPVGGVVAPGLQVQLVASLHPSALWTLITAAPAAYLNDDPGGFNAIQVEAYYQHRSDHPAAFAPWNVGLGLVFGPGQAPEGPGRALGLGQDPVDLGAGAMAGLGGDIDLQAEDRVADWLRPLSLLQWVGRRALTDTQFRVDAANRALIRRVINAYLTAYGAADPEDGVNNPRHDILYYFRDRADLAGQSTVLGRAISRNELHIVHLLIVYGADVNQVVDGMSVVDDAAFNLSMDRRRLESMFALLAAGANVDNLAQETLDEVATLMQNLSGYPYWGNDDDNYEYQWPTIDNLLVLPTRQFLGDERSSIEDRTLVAMFVLWHGNDNYPSFR